MIKISVYVNTQNRIQELHVCGHAFYAAYGSDIVCAAVSVLVINAINSCEALLGVTLPVSSDEEEGVLHCSIAQDFSSDIQANIDLLFRSTVFGLLQIATEHPKNVKLMERKI